MTVDNGYILLSRSIVDSAVFQNEKWLRVWLWCLLEATYKEKVTKSVKTGKGWTPVEITRGQFIFGRNKHARDLSMSPSTLWKIISKLKNIGNLDIQSNSHYSIITICNYELYQDADNYKVTGKVTTKEQPSDRQVTHLNKERKEKGKKKNTYSNEFEECWKIVPKRNGVREGKKKSSEYFEKLDLDDKRKCYIGLRNYAELCNTTDKIPKDFERFIKHRVFDDYQERINTQNQDDGKMEAQAEYEATQALINQ
jgi:hypothetical protein